MKENDVNTFNTAVRHRIYAFWIVAIPVSQYAPIIAQGCLGRQRDWTTIQINMFGFKIHASLHSLSVW